MCHMTTVSCINNIRRTYALCPCNPVSLLISNCCLGWISYPQTSIVKQVCEFVLIAIYTCTCMYMLISHFIAVVISALRNLVRFREWWVINKDTGFQCSIDYPFWLCGLHHKGRHGNGFEKPVNWTAWT